MHRILSGNILAGTRLVFHAVRMDVYIGGNLIAGIPAGTRAGILRMR